MNQSIPMGEPIDIYYIESISPEVSRCEIKILYTGLNRNGTYVSKEVANKMAKTLPGTPIVGEYRREIGDFEEHGEDDIEITANGVRFISSTSPYGFIPLGAKVWWQSFLDYDGVEREYLVCEGYLWTGRFPETLRVIEEGNHQSMELDPDSLVGEWAKADNEKGRQFIIYDAKFTGLCIMGQHVEPCFEGGNITRDSRLAYALKDSSFKVELAEFMLEIKEAMSSYNLDKGGVQMSKDKSTFVKDENAKDEEEKDEEEKDSYAADSVEEEEEKEEKPESDHSKDEDEDKKDKCSLDEEEEEEEDEDKEDYAVNDSDDSEEEEEEEEEYSEKDSDEKEEEEKDEYAKEEDEEKQEDEEEDKEDYSSSVAYKLIEAEKKIATLESQMYSLAKEAEALRSYKAEIEEAKKDTMIDSFYMLSDSDKAEIVENKAKYSLDEIEAKLSVLCVRNKVNFDLDTAEESMDKEEPVLTFNVQSATTSSSPAWLKAVDRVIKK